MALKYGLSYQEVEFTKEGNLFQPLDETALLAMIKASGATDLIIMAHGWNNDLNEARDLFDEWTRLLALKLPADRKFAVLGILWPSKKFADEDLIAGGGASLDEDAGLNAAKAQLEILNDCFDDTQQAILRQAIDLLPVLTSSQEAPQQFLLNIRSLLSSPGDQPMSDIDDRALRSLDPAEGKALLQRISAKVTIKQPFGFGGAASLGQSISLNTGSLWGDVVSGARMMANVLTYYTMKRRADLVGTNGLNPLLQTVRKENSSLKFHCVGHSFGALLVTATAANSTLPINSLSLLQAAFSHYGFAEHYQGVLDGVYRPVLTSHTDTNFSLMGPAFATFSRLDRAVGIAYAIASRIAGQVASSVGDKDDFYGGLGGNGAQLTPEAIDQYRLGDNYQFYPRHIYNIDSNNYDDGRPFINSHSDVRKPEVIDIVIAAISAK